VVVQIARAYKADVYATGSASNREHIEQLGATFIDRKESVAEYVRRHTGGRGFDVIYDTVAGQYWMPRSKRFVVSAGL